VCRESHLCNAAPRIRDQDLWPGYDIYRGDEGEAIPSIPKSLPVEGLRFLTYHEQLVELREVEVVVCLVLVAFDHHVHSVENAREEAAT